MKKTFAIAVTLGLLVSRCACAHAGQITADSRIQAVTVYPDSALITRAANVQLAAGEHEVVFAGIIPEIDESSLRVSAQNNNEVRLFGAKVKTEFLEETPAPRVQELTEQIQKLEDEAASVNSLSQVLADEKGFLDSIKMFAQVQVPKDLATRTPLAKDLEDNLKFLDVKLRENSQGVLENAVRQRELVRKTDALRRELAQVSGSRRKVKRSIIVDAQAARGVSAQIEVSYLVRGAYWEPLYDARADFEKSEVELALYGLVRQKTGEDWQQAEVSLSTARPAVGGSMPYVAPWFLRPYQPPQEDAGYLGNRPQSARIAKGMASQIIEFSDKALMKDGDALPAAPEPRTQVQDKGIAVVYALPKKADIKSDGEENKLPVTSQVLKAKFEYSAFPRAVLLAYLGSRVKNAPDLQLLGGRVNIFLAGDFVGSSAIENIGPGEEFDLYLGADENVKVKRELLEKKVDETLIGNIPSPNKATVFKYKLTAENYKGKPIDLKLFEAMPVSQDDRIKVKIEKAGLEPKVKDWKDRKGIWLWELTLAPKQKQEIAYSYTIEHPRDMAVEGL